MELLSFSREQKERLAEKHGLPSECVTCNYMLWDIIFCTKVAYRDKACVALKKWRKKK